MVNRLDFNKAFEKVDHNGGSGLRLYDGSGVKL